MSHERMHANGKKLIGACAATLLAVAGSAKADFTIDPALVAPAFEQPQLQIINNLYQGLGTAFTFNSTTKNFENSLSILVRVNDYNGADTTPQMTDPIAGDVNLVTGVRANADQIWTDGTADVQTQVKYAGFQQKFGYVLGASGGTDADFVQIGSDLQEGYQPANSTPVNFRGFFTDPNSTPVWRFARQGGNLDTIDGVTTQTTLTGDAINRDSLDHVLTYKLYLDKTKYVADATDGDPAVPVGGSTNFVWVLFFEDGFDRDYNDLVVEIAPSNIGEFAPLPAPLMTCSAGLLGLVGMKLRRRKLSAE